MGEDGPGRGHLCHTDTFLVLFIYLFLLLISIPWFITDIHFLPWFIDLVETNTARLPDASAVKLLVHVEQTLKKHLFK